MRAIASRALAAGLFALAAAHCGAPVADDHCADAAAPDAPPGVRPLAARTLRFAVVGDYGVGTADERAVATMVAGWDPAFVLTLGDNNYPDGAASTIEARVGRYYGAFLGDDRATPNRFFPSLGNHDWRTVGARPYLDYFHLPGNERYYDFVRGPVHFFALDSDPSEPDGISDASAQATWLRLKLRASTARWKVVYFHHPPYSSGTESASLTMRWPFCAWGASVVLAGHVHQYERLQVDDLTYVVNGAGGSVPHRFAKPLDGSIARVADVFGAQRATVTDEGLSFEFVTTDGRVADAFTLP